MLAAALGIAAGAAFCVRANASFDSAGVIQPISTPIVIAVCFFAAAAAVIGAYRNNRWLFVTALFFLVGAARIMLSVPDAVTAQDCAIVGTVVDLEETPNAAGRVEAVLGNASCEGRRLRYRVLLKLDRGDAASLAVGDRVSVRCASVSPTKASRGVYNERLARLASGISEKAEAKTNGIRILVKRAAPLRAAAIEARQWLGSLINRVFGDNAGIVSAFLLGEKDHIPGEVYDDMRTGGVAHLLTLSGFHVGLLTALLFYLLPKSRPVLRVAVIGAFLLVYCAVTGFGPSLVRASLMCMCLLFASAVSRRADTLSSLSLAAAVLLLSNPFMLYSVGFCLSFSATLGIVLIGSAGAFSTGGRFADKAVSAFFSTLGATAATLLIIARAFGSVYTYSLAANLLCVPLFSAAIVLSFLLMLIGLVSVQAASLLAVVPNKLIELALWLLRQITSLPYAGIDSFTPSELSCILMLVLLFSASGFILRSAKQKLRIVLPVFAVFTASLFADIIKA